MNNKFLRTLLVTFQIIIALAILIVDISGILHIKNFNESALFYESIIRCLLVGLFTFFYYNSLSSGFYSEPPFLPVNLFFLMLSETRILEEYSTRLCRFFIPPQVLVSVLIFSTCMLALTLFGYEIFYSNSGKDTSLFLAASVAASLVITELIPKALNIDSVWENKSLFLLISGIFALTFLISVVQFFSNSAGSLEIRHLVCMVLVVNNFINLFYNSFLMNLVGTGVFIISCILMITMTKTNATKL